MCLNFSYIWIPLDEWIDDLRGDCEKRPLGCEYNYILSNNFNQIFIWFN